MTESQFLKLTFHDKGIYLFTEGKYILSRENEYNNVKLYSLSNYNVEVFFSKFTNKISGIELVSLDSKKLYYDNINSVGVFT